MPFIYRPPTMKKPAINMLAVQLLFILIFFMCGADKIRYLSTEHPVLLYYNPKYVRYANVTTSRYGRRDPVYYINLNIDFIYPFHNNITVDIIFYEFLSNRYRRSFVEMHYKVCDLIHKDKFFGTALKQGKLNQPCPYPAGEYNMSNMTFNLKHIPESFPFTKGRIFANLTVTGQPNEHIGDGQIDMEIKEMRVKKN